MSAPKSILDANFYGTWELVERDGKPQKGYYLELTHTKDAMRISFEKEMIELNVQPDHMSFNYNGVKGTFLKQESNDQGKTKWDLLVYDFETSEIYAEGWVIVSNYWNKYQAVLFDDASSTAKESFELSVVIDERRKVCEVNELILNGKKNISSKLKKIK